MERRSFLSLLVSAPVAATAAPEPVRVLYGPGFAHLADTLRVRSLAPSSTDTLTLSIQLLGRIEL